MPRPTALNGALLGLEFDEIRSVEPKSLDVIVFPLLRVEHVQDDDEKSSTTKRDSFMPSACAARSPFRPVYLPRVLRKRAHGLRVAPGRDDKVVRDGRQVVHAQDLNVLRAFLKQDVPDRQRQFPRFSMSNTSIIQSEIISAVAGCAHRPRLSV